ncbi:hypothetical protein [Mucilaginibacter celer]|uniref:Lipoprotein n=1 Tax=Mucilaginibacter celer TaxID=2305508 RepID=A0A494W012_9SPHI|nr:hypothetical protein [Mucilaginibacter celer]AYL96572.1 hypothetical protein HYN43_015255 [Mucilaginibacter celer]
MKINLLAVSCLLVLSSCYSRLKVQVDSFDMKKMHESAEYKSGNRQEELLKYQTMIQSNAFDESGKQILTKVRSLLTTFADSGRYLDRYINPKIALIKPKLAEKTLNYKTATLAVSNALSALIKSDNEKTLDTYTTAYVDFQVAKTAFEQYKNELALNLLQPNLDSRTVLDQLNSLPAVATLTTFGNSIVNDNMASFVVKAPEEFWLKYKSSFYTNEKDLTKSIHNSSINVTKVTTFIGNSDIAVKMDGPGNFIIKGVRLDADEAFRTSFKVLNQGIKYLTYAAGIPTPVKDASPAVKIPELASYDQNKLKAETLNTQYQQLTDSFLKIIDAYKADLLSGNDAKRQNAIITLKKAYTYYKSQLPIQP